MERIEVLAALALSGDETAASAVIERLWPDAYRIAFSALHDRDAAQDAAQEACARAWSGFSRLRNPSRARIWFYRIVVNESKRMAMRYARERANVLEETEEDAFIAPHRAQESDERIDLFAALDALQKSLRVTILLRYYYGLTNAEVGRVLGILPVTVRWRLMMARRQLREILSVSDPACNQLSPSREVIPQ